MLNHGCFRSSKQARTAFLPGTSLLNFPPLSVGMKKVKNILQHTAKLLSDDVSLFRNIILNSGGGELPPAIKEKEKLLHDIEDLMKVAAKK